MLPGLTRDVFTVLSPAGGVSTDELGNPVVGEWSTVAVNLRGFLGTPGRADVASAAQRDVQVTNVLATRFNVARVGDRVQCRGREYTVTAVVEVASRTHVRLFLSAVEA